MRRLTRQDAGIAGAVLAAALAACSSPPGSTADPAPSASPSGSAAPTASAAPSAGTPLVVPPGLAGEWRVAGIDGQPFDEPYGLALSANEHEIWWAPRCAGMTRRYRIQGRRLAVFPAADSAAAPGTAAAGTAPPPPCAIGLPARLHEVVRALDAAETVVRTPANGVEISGGGHSLLLFSQ
jgi:hypothetical protein